MYDMWKDFYFQSSNLVDDKVKEEFPSQGMGQVLEMNLQFKKLLNETTEQYLEQVNMPTRNDLANISSLIVNVDAKIDDLEELVEDTKANQVDQEAIQRELTTLKRDMKNLDVKLNQVLSMLKESKEEKTNVNKSASASATAAANATVQKAQQKN
jgi:polyhydroxyalkanoic acid synthase PhaR subunit